MTREYGRPTATWSLPLWTSRAAGTRGNATWPRAYRRTPLQTYNSLWLGGLTERTPGGNRTGITSLHVLQLLGARRSIRGCCAVFSVVPAKRRSAPEPEFTLRGWEGPLPQKQT